MFSGVEMIGERKVQRKRWSWLALVWLGTLLMLGALTLPAQAAGGFVAPTSPDSASRGDAAGRVRAALAIQGYTVTSVGLDGDDVAGVIMQAASQTLDDTAWEQVQAGWQVLADAYPQAGWLLSGIQAGDRYLVCFVVARSSPTATAQAGVYDTLLGRWIQHKDFAHKDFGTTAHSGEPSPAPGPAPSPAPASEVSPDDLEGQPTSSDLLSVLDRFADHVTMHVEDRRRLVEPRDAQPSHWRSHLQGTACAPLASGDALAVPSPDSSRTLAPAFRREVLAAARWCKRTYAGDSPSRDADEDPADAPPPVTHPLLISPLTFDTQLALCAALPLATYPDPTIHLHIDVDTTSQVPRHLLAWPALRVRPPPGFAPPTSVFPLA